MGKVILLILFAMSLRPVGASALPANISMKLLDVSPSYQLAVEEALVSLPPRLRRALERPHNIEVYLRNGEILGAAASHDNLMGIAMETPQVYVRWPKDQETVEMPWGKITLAHAIRHELAHLGLELIFSADSSIWDEMVKSLREEGPDFLRRATWGHQGAEFLYSRSAIAHYESLQEYLASLIEFCGQEVRMPLPQGRARKSVQELVLGGDCQ